MLFLLFIILIGISIGMSLFMIKILDSESVVKSNFEILLYHILLICSIGLTVSVLGDLV